MKIAASDYDGTLFRRGQVSREDLEAIRAWRKRGHLFGPATGRDLNLTRSELELREIPFDFIICNTGASVYARDYTPIHLASLPPDAAESVLRHPATRDSRYCLFSRAGKTFIDMWASESWLTGLGLPLTAIDGEEAVSMIGLQQIGLEFASIDLATRNAAIYNRDLGPAMYAQQSNICVDIVPMGSSKAAGLAALIELERLNPTDVLAIGDSENDLSMIQRFQGYAMEESPPEIKNSAGRVVDSVAAMLRENMDD